MKHQKGQNNNRINKLHNQHVDGTKLCNSPGDEYHEDPVCEIKYQAVSNLQPVEIQVQDQPQELLLAASDRWQKHGQ